MLCSKLSLKERLTVCPTKTVELAGAIDRLCEPVGTIVKVVALLYRVPTFTFRGPVVAPFGTVAVICELVQFVG